MVARAVEVIAAVSLGRIAAVIVAVCLVAPLVAIILAADTSGQGLTRDWATVRFTLVQAILSTVVSVTLAIPAARALARRRFRGRGALITLLGAPFLLPVIVAIVGLLAVFGRAGVLNQLFEALGLPSVRIYGLQGVVLAHVFFNLPLATRMILQGWQSIPGERLRLAASLNMTPPQVFRTLELPMLRAVLPGTAAVIFALCLSSFAVALTLGGGPRATTLELAIYQAFRFEFDLGHAAGLAMVQLALAGLAAVVALWVAPPPGFGAGLDRVVRRWDSETALAWAVDLAVLALVALFLVVPLVMVVLAGLPGLAALPGALWRAAGISVAVALCATVLVIALALMMGRKKRFEAAAYLALGLSPMVIGTGYFLMIHPLVDPARFAFAVTVLVNALMALPFALRVLGPEMRQVEQDFGALADVLDMRGMARLRWLTWPRLRRSLGFSAGLTAALSMGDLGVVALFAAPDFATLPLQMYSLMGAYRMEAAAGAGLILLALSLLLFWLFDRGGRGNVDG